MTGKTIVSVKEWFFDKINEECKKYNCVLVGEYKDGKLDHTRIRVNEVLAETEKAFRVEVEAETFSGNYKSWKTWLPKSVIAE